MGAKAGMMVRLEVVAIVASAMNVASATTAVSVTTVASVTIVASAMIAVVAAVETTNRVVVEHYTCKIVSSDLSLTLKRVR